LFEKGRLYRRDELHLEWGGQTRVQAQGGILTPTEVPVIIVVTGEAGGQYGYDDEWDADGVFHYYGAGQVGDMVFQRGNLALRDHALNGEDLHLFEQEPSGLRYVGQVVGAGYDEIDDVPDRNGDPRRAIVDPKSQHAASRPRARRASALSRSGIPPSVGFAGAFRRGGEAS
jgi:5-methylcytosine-specific restriction protein A